MAADNLEYFLYQSQVINRSTVDRFEWINHEWEGQRKLIENIRNLEILGLTRRNSGYHFS